MKRFGILLGLLAVSVFAASRVDADWTMTSPTDKTTVGRTANVSGVGQAVGYGGTAYAVYMEFALGTNPQTYQQDSSDTGTSTNPPMGMPPTWSKSLQPPYNNAVPPIREWKHEGQDYRFRLTPGAGTQIVRTIYIGA